MPTSLKNNPGCLARLFGFANRDHSGFNAQHTQVDRLTNREGPLPYRMRDDFLTGFNAQHTQVDRLTNREDPLPYRVRDDFLTPAELSFYRVLLHITRDALTVCPKIRLADLFFVSNPNQNRKYFNYIVGKHVDFLVCSPETMRPILAIELDDASHNNSDRIERDEFVDRAFKDASIPLLRVPARRQYAQGEIANLLAPHLPQPSAPITLQKEEPVVSQKPQENPAPICPKCGLPMLLRTVTQGEHKGKQFYGCKNYPHCREVRPYRLAAKNPV